MTNIKLCLNKTNKLQVAIFEIAKSYKTDVALKKGDFRQCILNVNLKIFAMTILLR